MHQIFVYASNMRQIGAQGARVHLGGEMCSNHCVFLSKVDSPTISRERDEGDPHHLRSLRTKVGQGSAAILIREHRALTLDRRNPYSRELFGEKVPAAAATRGTKLIYNIFWEQRGWVGYRGWGIEQKILRVSL